jgi:hypothetical protein
MTAVEWLEEIIYGDKEFSLSEVFEQAKQMEKQQIEESHRKGQHYSDRFEVPHQIAAEEYYINKFKSE